MIVFRLTVQHQTIVLVTGTSFKMASIVCKKANHFCHKSSKFCIVRTIRFCSNLFRCGPNTYQIMHGGTLDFQCQ